MGPLGPPLSQRKGGVAYYFYPCLYRICSWKIWRGIKFGGVAVWHSNGQIKIHYSVPISESLIRASTTLILILIGGERERAPHLIVRRKFVCPSVRLSVCPSVRLSVCPVWLTEHARENNTCSLLGHGHASLPIICACSNQMIRVKGDRESREERSKNEGVGSNIS